MRRLVLLCVAMLAAGLLSGGAAAPVAADDRSVYRAFSADDRFFIKLSQKRDRAYRAWSRRDFRRPGTLLRIVRRARGVTIRARRGVRAEEPSTALGARAKRVGLRSVRWFLRGLRLEARAIRRVSFRRARSVRRAFAPSERAHRRNRVYLVRSRNLFRRADATSERAANTTRSATVLQRWPSGPM